MNLRRLVKVLTLRPLWDQTERRRKARLIERVKPISDAAIAETYRSLRQRVANGYIYPRRSR